jgi:hypothetical protein
MNFLVWRLHRNQVYFAAAALAALTVLLLITGSVMAHDYRQFLANCGATQSCDTGRLFSGDGAIIDLVNLTLVIPLLFGLFWGAPLLAKEFEDGTHNLAWTQGVPRHTWLRTNLMWALAAAAVWGAALAALVSWWRYPENAINSRFDAFDIQGIVPVAYALFAVALGIAIGAIFRRVLPALATTLGAYFAVRLPIAIWLRPRFMMPVTKLFPLQGASQGPAGSWTVSSSIVGPHGHDLGQSFSLNQIPAACQTGGVGEKGISGNCLTAHGFHQLVTYQPASRFWAFQGIEAGIFVILAVALVLFARWWVLRRDA